MPILGIDIAKATFEVYLINADHSCRHNFSNSESGFAALSGWLAKQEVTALHACMEATGRYYEPLAEYLVAQGYPVSVVNPWQIKAYRESQLRRTKNDSQDARLIALFCQQQQPAWWTPLTDEQKRLQALTRHLDGLKESAQQLKNRLECCPDDFVQQSLQGLIDDIQEQIKQTEQEIESHVNQTQSLNERVELLCSIPGIGFRTAANLLGEIPRLAEFDNAKQVTAYAGLNPSEFQSGSSVRGKPKLSKIGNRRVRKFLYFPALSTIRHNPLVKALRDRLLKRGLAKMAAVGAAMRKLLHIAFGVLKNRTPFDPNIATTS